jgi:hypothetical protein
MSRGSLRVCGAPGHWKMWWEWVCASRLTVYWNQSMQRAQNAFGAPKSLRNLPLCHAIQVRRESRSGLQAMSYLAFALIHPWEWGRSRTMEKRIWVEVFTAVIMENAVFSDVAPCRSCVNRRFVGTYRLHLQVEISASEQPTWAVKSRKTRWMGLYSTHGGMRKEFNISAEKLWRTSPLAMHKIILKWVLKKHSKRITRFVSSGIKCRVVC